MAANRWAGREHRRHGQHQVGQGSRRARGRLGRGRHERRADRQRGGAGRAADREDRPHRRLDRDLRRRAVDTIERADGGRRPPGQLRQGLDLSAGNRRRRRLRRDEARLSGRRPAHDGRPGRARFPAGGRAHRLARLLPRPARRGHGRPLARSGGVRRPQAGSPFQDAARSAQGIHGAGRHDGQHHRRAPPAARHPRVRFVAPRHEAGAALWRRPPARLPPRHPPAAGQRAGRAAVPCHAGAQGALLAQYAGAGAAARCRRRGAGRHRPA